MDLKVTTRSQELEDNGWVEAGTHWYCEPVFPMPNKIKGCPLGRGRTEKESIADLIRRIQYESKVEIRPIIQNNEET